MFFLTLTCFGEALFAIGVNDHSYPGAYFGRFVTGSGEGAVSLMSGTLIGYAFFSSKAGSVSVVERERRESTISFGDAQLTPTDRRGLVLALGITEALHALSNSLSTSTAVPLTDAFGGYYVAPLIASFFACVFSLLIGVACLTGWIADGVDRGAGELQQDERTSQERTSSMLMEQEEGDHGGMQYWANGKNPGDNFGHGVASTTGDHCSGSVDRRRNFFYPCEPGPLVGGAAVVDQQVLRQRYSDPGPGTPISPQHPLTLEQLSLQDMVSGGVAGGMLSPGSASRSRRLSRRVSAESSASLFSKSVSRTPPVAVFVFAPPEGGLPASEDASSKQLPHYNPPSSSGSRGPRREQGGPRDPEEVDVGFTTHEQHQHVSEILLSSPATSDGGRPRAPPIPMSAPSLVPTFSEDVSHASGVDKTKNRGQSSTTSSTFAKTAFVQSMWWSPRQMKHVKSCGNAELVEESGEGGPVSLRRGGLGSFVNELG